MAIFVVKEHWARSHHFDFRLEKDGVFKSWAVPKGLPESPGVKRLAVQVEDHELEFAPFHEANSEGESVKGRIKVWDHGTYELEELSAVESKPASGGRIKTSHFFPLNRSEMF
jgi:DNA ligase D-like protein (predicted 3'-phosphoesterase)